MQEEADPERENQQIDAEWLRSAVEYLLISNLNLAVRKEPGDRSNRRLTNAFLEILRAVQPTVFCDIGANDGSMASLVKAEIPGCHVLAFEANPEIHLRHKDLPSLAGVKYLNVAISDTDGPVKIFAPRTLSRAYVAGEVVPMTVTEGANTGKTSLRFRDEEATYTKFQVAGSRLDEIVAREVGAASHQRVFLWIDVEGAADLVLAGAEETLRDTCAVFIETENFAFWQDQKLGGDITRILVSKGFIPVGRDRAFGDAQFNILFLRPDIVPLIYNKLFDLDERSSLHQALRVDQHPAAYGPHSTSGHAGSRIFGSVAASQMAGTPILIPTFNNRTYTEGMISQIEERGLSNIIIVDNASTFPEMQEYLASVAGRVTVLSLADNRGPRDIFLSPANLTSLPDVFCVTDPDLELNPELPEDFLAELLHVTEQHKLGKAGFSLDISDREEMVQESFLIGDNRYRIWEWESQFWQRTLGTTTGGDPVYAAGIDTTFALYNKKYFDPEKHFSGARVGGRYTCRHLPWYRANQMSQGEEAYYRSTQKHSFYLANPADIVMRGPPAQPGKHNGEVTGSGPWKRSSSAIISRLGLVNQALRNRVKSVVRPRNKP